MKTNSIVAFILVWLGSLICTTTSHATQVFVSRDAQGNLIFSDRASPNAEQHRIKPLPTVPAFEYETPDTNVKFPAIADEAPIRSDGFEYQFLTILYPRDQDNLPPGVSATLEIMVGLRPKLRPQDQLVLLDNGTRAYTGRDLTISMSNLNPGQHLLQLAIEQPNGDLVQHSEGITIYVQRHSVLRNQAR